MQLMNDIALVLVQFAIGWGAQWLISRGWLGVVQLWRERGYAIVPLAKLHELKAGRAAAEIELVRKDLHIDELRNALAAALSQNPAHSLSGSHDASQPELRGREQ